MKLSPSCVPMADWAWPSSWFCLVSSPSTGLTPSSSRAQRWITELQAAVYRSWPSGRPVLPLLPSCVRMASSSPPREAEPEASPALPLTRSLSLLRATSRAERKHWNISGSCHTRTQEHTHKQDAGLENKQQQKSKARFVQMQVVYFIQFSLLPVYNKANLITLSKQHKYHILLSSIN